MEGNGPFLPQPLGNSPEYPISGLRFQGAGTPAGGGGPSAGSAAQGLPPSPSLRGCPGLLAADAPPLPPLPPVLPGTMWVGRTAPHSPGASAGPAPASPPQFLDPTVCVQLVGVSVSGIGMFVSMQFLPVDSSWVSEFTEFPAVLIHSQHGFSGATFHSNSGWLPQGLPTLPWEGAGARGRWAQWTT